VSLSFHDRATDFFDDLRNYGVSEGSKLVHPAGYPISQQTNSGLRDPPPVEGRSVVPVAAAFSGREFLRY
jgi:hypothetical protein